MKRQQAPQAAVGQQVQVPPPVGGINRRDAVTSMPTQDAITLTNIFPEPSYAFVRRGCTEWATGFTSPAETLLEWAGTPTQFFAAAAGDIFDITSPGAIGAAVETGKSNARWQSTMFSNTGGTYLVAVNGADGVLTYDGTSWATQSITGATAASFVQVATYKKRLWFAPNSGSSAYFLGLDAIAGAATEFPLGGIWRLGGNLARIFAMNYDSLGAGLTEYIGFLSSQGELAVYTGTDPTSATAFQLVGRYRIAGPGGARTSADNGADVNILTQDGVLSLLGVVEMDPTKALNASLSSKITPLLREDWLTYGGLSGWQIINYAPAHALIVNVPTSATTARQYVMNTLSGAWCQFTGWDAYCFGMFGSSLYYGGSTQVFKAWDGLSDNGSAIITRLDSAFNSFKAPGRQKFFTMLRPILTASRDPQALIGVSVDYQIDELGSPYVVMGGGSLWDVALWDEAVWGGDLTQVTDWATVGAIGRAASVGFATATLGVDFRINGFDLMLEPAQGPAL